MEYSKMFGAIPHPKLGVFICTPHPYIWGPDQTPRLEPVDPRWYRARQALITPTNWAFVEMQQDGLEVGIARTNVAMAAMKHNPKPEFIFFLDHDVVPLHDAIVKLLYRARQYPDIDIFGGLYTTKRLGGDPIMYKDYGTGPYQDWALGDLVFDLAAIHMGCTLIRTSLFERIECTADRPWFKTEAGFEFIEGKGVRTNRGTEDIYFCKRAVEEAGARIMVDTSVLCGHIDYGTGRMYGLTLDSPAAQRALWHPLHPSNQKKGAEPEKLALDLGAGSFPGINRTELLKDCKIETTDIRPGIGVNYVQDTRWLNLPTGRYDVTTSNHHMEHIPRFEQEQAWGEVYRVTKLGGKTEHWVPNVEWAARHIVDGNCDGHVMNVLYGGQENEYGDRNSNVHYFGFTPANLRALMEGAGFVDVEIITYRDDPLLGYHMIGRGRKPNDGEAERRDKLEVWKRAKEKARAAEEELAAAQEALTDGEFVQAADENAAPTMWEGEPAPPAEFVPSMEAAEMVAEGCPHDPEAT